MLLRLAQVEGHPRRPVDFAARMIRSSFTCEAYPIVEGLFGRPQPEGLVSQSVERRSARRLAVSYVGELASGSSVTRVKISDVSPIGCGVESIEPHISPIGHSGVLCIRGVRGNSAIMLPVVVANQRIDADKHRIGLQFRTMSTGQTSDLSHVLDQAIGL